MSDLLEKDRDKLLCKITTVKGTKCRNEGLFDGLCLAHYKIKKEMNSNIDKKGG